MGAGGLAVGLATLDPPYAGLSWGLAGGIVGVLAEDLLDRDLAVELPVKRQGPARRPAKNSETNVMRGT